MEYILVAIVLAITGVVLLLLVRRRAPWRLTMIVPTVAVFLAGLLVFSAQHWLTWQSAALWLGVTAVFYGNMLLVWRIYGAVLQQHGLRW